MDLQTRAALSYYKEVAVLNREHNIYLVQHRETGQAYVRKHLDIYSRDVFHMLKEKPVQGIPRIYEFAEDDEGAVLIEEYIPGTTLSELISGRSMSEGQAVSLVSGLCDILTTLHTQKPPIIHRDIKPSNVIVRPSGHPVLIDLNAARLYEPNKEEDTVLLGTKGYAAPEQYGFGQSTPRTDIYAMGALLREVNLSLTEPSDRLDAIAEKCMMLDPSERYVSAQTLKTALSKALNIHQDNDLTGAGGLSHLPDEGSHSNQAQAGGRSQSGTGGRSPVGSDNSGGSDKTVYSKTEGHQNRNNADNNQIESTKQADHDIRQHGLRRFLPPGFRTGRPWHMIIASLVYVYWTMLFFAKIPAYYNAKRLLYYRLYPYLAGIATILIQTNWLDIQAVAPFRKNRNRVVRYIGVLILNAAVVFVLYAAIGTLASRL